MSRTETGITEMGADVTTVVVVSSRSGGGGGGRGGALGKARRL